MRASGLGRDIDLAAPVFTARRRVWVGRFTGKPSDQSVSRTPWPLVRANLARLINEGA